MVGEEVDLIDVQHRRAAASRPGWNRSSPPTARRASSDPTTRPRWHRAATRRTGVTGRRQPRERRLGRSLLPPQQHASDVAIDTRDAQRELRVVLTDDSVERKDVHLASS
jgi:hypothetical protein